MTGYLTSWLVMMFLLWKGVVSSFSIYISCFFILSVISYTFYFYILKVTRINTFLYDIVCNVFAILTIISTKYISDFFNLQSIIIGNLIFVLAVCVFVWKAISLVNKRLKKQSQKYYEKGIQNFDEKKYNLALKYLNKAVKYYPKNYKLYYWRGVIYLELDIFEKAIKEFNKTLLLLENESSIYGFVYCRIGEAYDELGKSDKGLEYYLKAYKYFKENDNIDTDDCKVTLWEIARIYENEGQLEKSIKYLEERNRLHPNETKVLHSLGYDYDQLKMEDKALRYYLKAYDCANEEDKKEEFHLANLWNIAKIYDIKSEYNKAISYLEELLELDLENYGRYYKGLIFLGIMYFEVNDLEKAKETFMKGIGSDKVEERLDSYYWLIIVNIKQDNIEGAKEFYRKAIEIKSDFIEIYGWEEIDLNKEEVEQILTQKVK